MSNLITVEEFKGYRYISNKPDEKKIEENINQAQTIELFRFLGNFYFDVVENKDNLTYLDLLEGSNFIVDGLVYNHAGIKSILADLTFSRYIFDINANLTAFGSVTKSTEDSEPTSQKKLDGMSSQATSDASTKFILTKKYIEANPDLFPRFCRSDKGKGDSFNNIKVTVV